MESGLAYATLEMGVGWSCAGRIERSKKAAWRTWSVSSSSFFKVRRFHDRKIFAGNCGVA